jgi:hypothetical protein
MHDMHDLPKHRISIGSRLGWDKPMSTTQRIKDRFARNRVRAYVAVYLMALALFPACRRSSAPEPIDFQGSVSEGICLVQLHAGSLEIVPLRRSQRTERRPRISVGSYSKLLLWGRVAPDGTFVAGVLSASGRDPLLVIGVALDGRELWKFESEFPGVPAFSPDGQRLAFTAAGQLTLYDTSTGELTKLGIAGQNPSWAPAGDRFAYDTGTNTNPYDEHAKVHVYDVSRKTSSPVGPGTHPSWLPDGQRIAVRAGSGRVELVNLQTGERREFLSAPSVTVPRWSPDGRWMMYTKEGGVPWWSLKRASEPHQIMIRDTSTGAEMPVGVFYKANPGDYTWVLNQTLCRSDDLGG